MLACRDQARGEAALKRILESHPAAEACVQVLDLAELASIRSFAADYSSSHDHLDILVNNAGVMAIPRRETADGFEMQFGTNHLGHFALTGLLLDKLIARPGSRVVDTVQRGGEDRPHEVRRPAEHQALREMDRLRPVQARQPAVHARARQKGFVRKAS